MHCDCRLYAIRECLGFSVWNEKKIKIHYIWRSIQGLIQMGIRAVGFVIFMFGNYLILAELNHLIFISCLHFNEGRCFGRGCWFHNLTEISTFVWNIHRRLKRMLFLAVNIDVNKLNDFQIRCLNYFVDVTESFKRYRQITKSKKISEDLKDL